MRDADNPLCFLIYSQFTVMSCSLYAWVPFICLPIFISLENMDRRLLEAATDLGASRLQAFRKITLPLAAPGIVAAFLFVFIPSIGEYITPSLVGGTEGYMFGQAVADQFVGGAFDWQGGQRARAVPARRRAVPDRRDVEVPAAAGGGDGMSAVPAPRPSAPPTGKAAAAARSPCRATAGAR